MFEDSEDEEIMKKIEESSKKHDLQSEIVTPTSTAGENARAQISPTQVSSFWARQPEHPFFVFLKLILFLDFS